MRYCTAVSENKIEEPTDWLELMDVNELRSRAKFRRIKGVAWFARLKPSFKDNDTGLLGYYGPEHLMTGVILARDIKLFDNRPIKAFAWFPNKEEAAKYTILHFSPDRRHFYELIGGTSTYQHPYFDIDIPGNIQSPEDVLMETQLAINASLLIHGIIGRINHKVYPTIYPINEETKCPKKYSYHIVISNVVLKNNEEMKEIGGRVIEYCNQYFNRCYVDRIWNSTRQLRLLGSSKFGSSSCKTMENKDKIDTQEKLIKQIVKSFVGIDYLTKLVF